MRTGHTKSAQTELNILRLIHSHAHISRVVLAKVSGMSTATMSGTVHSLLRKKLVVGHSDSSGAVGRRRISLRIRPDLGYVVGVDLGTFNLRVLIVDMSSNIVYSRTWKTQMPRGREDVIRRTFEAIHEAIHQAATASGIDPKAILGIGMGHSGVIDVDRGVVLSFPRPGQMEEWRNVPLRSMVEAEFGIPCLLEDSARAIALAERHFGAGGQFQDFMYIDVGMGIGAAIFIDGLLYRGSGGSAGEIGHITLEEAGPLCFCGNRGCLEALASCAAIIENVKAAIRQGVGTMVAEMVDGDLDRIDVETIAQAAAKNDSLSYRALNEAAAHIGAAAADLVNLLNPSALIFGGALFRAAPDFLLKDLQRTIRQRALEKSANDAQLLVSSLGSDAGARGAAWLIAEKLLPSLHASSRIQAAADPDPVPSSLS